MFGRALGDDGEVCDVLVGAVHGGEAAVDFVLLAEGPALERLRSGAGCPVIAVMALISCCAADLEVLRDAVESSDRWDTALRLWMRWNCKEVEPNQRSRSEFFVGITCTADRGSSFILFCSFA